MFKVLSKSIIFMFLYDMIVFELSSIFWYKELQMNSNYFVAIIVLTTITGLLTLFLKSNYKIREFNNTAKNCYLLFEGIVFSQIPALILLVIMTKSITAVEFAVLNIITIFVLLKLYRFLFHYYLFNIKKIKNILIIGNNENAKLIAKEIADKKALRMQVAGFISETNDVKEENTWTFNDDLAKIIKEKNIDIVIVSINKRMQEAILTEMVNSIPKSVKLFKMTEFYEMVTGKYFIDEMSINELFYCYMENRSTIYNVCKRLYDIIAAVIILTVTFPILLYIAIRVKLTDGGNPIFTQNRIGKNGKVFKAYKLRTMYENDYVPTSENIESRNGQDSDSRVIPFCKFVRKARFDEIPQMINILKGDMSIVGPRAEWEELVNIYMKEVEGYAARMWTKTGWTGWAQINQGHCVSSDDITEKLKYDLYYQKNRNIIWEIEILVKAVFMALGGRHE